MFDECRERIAGPAGRVPADRGHRLLRRPQFACVSADRLALAREAEAGDKKAARALKVLERLSFMLPGAQFGITVTGLVVSFIVEPSVSALLRPVLSGTGLPDAAVSAVSVVLAFVGATVVQMVLGEFAPKNLAIAVPDRLAKALAGSTLAYLKVVGPVVHVFDGVANRLLRRVGIEPSRAGSGPVRARTGRRYGAGPALGRCVHRGQGPPGRRGSVRTKCRSASSTASGCIHVRAATPVAAPTGTSTRTRAGSESSSATTTTSR